MVCVCLYYVVSSFVLALIPAKGIEKIKLDGEINQIPFVTPLVISWLLPGTCHPSRDILSSGFIRADDVEKALYHLNFTYYSKSFCIAQDTMKMLHLSIQTSNRSFSL